MDGGVRPRSPGAAIIPVTHGQVRATAAPDAAFSVILGSCVATLIWDPEAGVGGINHLLLPGAAGPDPAYRGPDVNLMERLINGVLAAGGRRHALCAKMFGGARLIDGLGAPGAVNTRFVEGFLEAEGIPCLARSTGGTLARRLRVWPARGRVWQKLLEASDPHRAPRSSALREEALRLSGVELL